MYGLNPFLLDATGQKVSKFSFKIEKGIEASWGATSLLYKGEFWILGGYEKNQAKETFPWDMDQILRVKNCGIVKAGKLRISQIDYGKPPRTFLFSYGKSANHNDKSIYLCFSYWWHSGCYKSNKPTGLFTKTKKENEPKFSHRFTSFAASTEQIVACGSGRNKDFKPSYTLTHNKCEIMNFKDEIWQVKQSYPYARVLSFLSPKNLF